MEEPCPNCGSEMVFHHHHAEPAKTFSKCLSCGYDWQGKVQADLILVKKNLERRVAQELKRHPHLKKLLKDAQGGKEPPTGV